ncbi:hypothetical protein SO802_003715 [Lithocarpus litseifolius]|uniref:RNase H type-1 domain-containing protein n=1 Tax=Lithocarpus litseifolius TaxID=425828 RepID=A0AAW2E1S7_9ROSI
MEDLAQSWKRLSLSDREGLGCCLTEDERVHQFSIAAKFTTKRAINVDSIVRTFNPLWRAKKGFKIQKIGDHEMLFSFETKEDVDSILSSEPWSFNKHLVIMQRYDHEQPFQDVKFEKTTFWVQVHGLPMKYMTAATAEKICGVVGDVISHSEQKFYDGGDNKQVWVSFRYERLPNICYWCGSLLHDDRDCERWIESEGTLKADQREFGPGLRAQPFVVSKKNVVSVPGYYSTRKKDQPGKACQPMAEMIPAYPNSEPTIEPEGAKEANVRYKSGCNHNSMHNGRSGLNPIKTTDPIITPLNNSIIYGIPEDSTNVETVPTKETYIAEVSGEEKEAEVESMPRDGTNCMIPIQKLNKKNPHVPSRVSTQTKRVLPSWTRRSKPATQTQKQTTPKISGKKRELVISKDQVELTPKRVGVVIRDHRGWVIASCSQLIHQQLGSNEIEALAAGWALSFALDVGVNRAVLEGDSWSVIKGLKEEERLLIPLGLLIEDAKKLSHCFVELCYSHTKRECNSLAHNLARYAVCIPDFLVWMKEVPSQFQNVLQADSVGLFQ